MFHQFTVWWPSANISSTLHRRLANPAPTLIVDRSELDPGTASLDQLSETKYQEYLLSLRSVESFDGSRHNYSAEGDAKLADILRTKIYAYVFSNLPHRLINLQQPGFELQDRSSIAKHLTSPEKLYEGVDKIKKMELEAFGNSGQKMSSLRREALRDEATTMWIDHITRFAILSHTWERGELSYDDFRNQKDLSGSHLHLQEESDSDQDQIRSLKKLHNFCRISCKYADFAWADNVCIENSVFSELDEAIRSMFAWYRRAFICIVYLGETDSLLHLVHHCDRWFTRGWTLQELLAPRRLKFYGKNWHRLTDFLNDKISKENGEQIKLLQDQGLSRQLELLTGTILKYSGISMDHISSFVPGIHHPPLPERMRWAARRSTTKAEDRSYSLMGMFSVSFPTAYGEGRERAFFRLFQAVLEVGYQRNWFIWTGIPISPSIHPSRMIPSSPDCYAHVESYTSGWNGETEVLDEPINLTNLGLCMSILFVPVEIKCSLQSSRFGDDIPSHITITCPLISNKTIEMCGVKYLDPLADTKHTTKVEFALGILNINPEDVTQYPDRLYAILLQRTVTRRLDLSTYRNWKKCDTDEVITFEHYDKSRISKAEVEQGSRARRAQEKLSFRTMYL